MGTGRHVAGSPRCVIHRCLTHNADEAYFPKTDYLVCGECFHVFRTEHELVSTTNAMLAEFARFEGIVFDDYTSGDDVIACPHCAHDF